MGDAWAGSMPVDGFWDTFKPGEAVCDPLDVAIEAQRRIKVLSCDILCPENVSAMQASRGKMGYVYIHRRKHVDEGPSEVRVGAGYCSASEDALVPWFGLSCNCSGACGRQLGVMWLVALMSCLFWLALF